jgi:hypothetical protein
MESLESISPKKLQTRTKGKSTKNEKHVLLLEPALFGG